MKTWLLAIGLILVSSPILAQDRDTKVRDDRKSFQSSRGWIYNDLGEGVRAAKEAGKPLLVVFRCIPCEACQEFDDDVARRDSTIRDLLDEFVCVRIVQANTIDLTRFQHDFEGAIPKSGGAERLAVVKLFPQGGGGTPPMVSNSGRSRSWRSSSNRKSRWARTSRREVQSVHVPTACRYPHPPLWQPEPDDSWPKASTSGSSV